MSRAARLFSLLQALRRHGAPVTAATLAAELEVSERTIYRDIATLMAQGAQIHGEAGVGYVLRPGFFLPPLMFNADELEAVVLGLCYVHQRGDALLSKAAAEAHAKIRAVLPREAREVLENPIALPGPPGRPFPENAVALDVLRDAIRARMKLRIEYTDGGGARSERTVWPLAIGFMNDARILVTWCEARGEYRHFRTDRIASAEDTGARYPGSRIALLRAWRAHMKLDPTGRFAPDST